MFQYQVINILVRPDLHGAELQDELNEWGEDGWELQHVFKPNVDGWTRVVLKRQKPVLLYEGSAPMSDEERESKMQEAVAAYQRGLDPEKIYSVGEVGHLQHMLRDIPPSTPYSIQFNRGTDTRCLIAGSVVIVL